jgi:hypothetical protein
MTKVTKRLALRALLAAGVLPLVIASLGLSAGAAPAATSRPSESTLLIAALPKFTCPAGTVKLMPASAHRTAHGADVYHYAMKSGPGFDAYVPPAGFKPLTASNAVLAEMDMPTRPSNRTELASWKEDMSNYKTTKQPEFCESKIPFAQPAGKHTLLSKGSGTQAAHYGSDNWSGYVDTDGPYTATGARWYQTGVGACGCTGPTDEVTWVGLGGWNSGDLLQDGTRNYSDDTPYAWFEYLGDTTVSIISADSTTVGDTIEAQLFYSTATDGTAQFLVHDDSAVVLNATEPDMAGDYDGSTTEWIIERPTQCYPDSCYDPLSNTGTTDFWTANGVNSSGEVPVADGGVFSVLMNSDGSASLPPCSASPTLLQYPDTLSGDSFESHWCQAS